MEADRPASPPPADQSQEVVVYRGDKIVSRMPLASRMEIGRMAGMDIQIEDPALSRRHAMILSDGSHWFLTDENSLNGTFLNGRKLIPMQLTQIASGDVAELGGFRLLFQLAPEAAVPSTPPLQPSPASLEPPPDASPLLEQLVERHHEIPLWREGEVQLKVADIVEETHDVKTFRLVGTSPLLFSFRPGQFVTLKLNIEGTEVLRSYTISSSPSRPHCLEITIKRTCGGLVSNWMCDHVKLGDLLTVRGPSGKFSCFNFPSRKILFIGAGSGITPLISMLRWIVDTAADVDAHLFVSAKSSREIIFRNELNWMSSRHSGIRVAVTCTSRVTGADAWTGLTGRMDAAMLKLLTPDILERHIFMCGPGPFMEAVKDCLRSIGFPLSNLHTESFGPARVVQGEPVEARDVPKRDVPPVLPSEPVPPPASTPPPQAQKSGFHVHFARSGKSVSTDGEASILDLAEANGVEIDYGCRSGFCGACRIKLSRGEVQMSDNDLPVEERAAGYIYACAAKPVSDIEVDA